MLDSDLIRALRATDGALLLVPVGASPKGKALAPYIEKLGFAVKIDRLGIRWEENAVSPKKLYILPVIHKNRPAAIGTQQNPEGIFIRPVFH